MITNNLNLYFKELEEGQNKHKVSRRKKLMMITAKSSKLETRKQRKIHIHFLQLCSSWWVLMGVAMHTCKYGQH